MNNPLHAHYYADAALERRVPIVENVLVARDTYLVRFPCSEIAQRIVPGQFLMVRLAGCDDPLIGRPLAVYDVVRNDAGQPEAIDLIYHVKGKFTRRLCVSLPGQLLDVWGPLGNGFPPLPCDHLIMVAGGVGQTPFLTLAKEHLGRVRFGTPPRAVTPVPQVTLCFGAQSECFLAGVEDFLSLGRRRRVGHRRWFAGVSRAGHRPAGVDVGRPDRRSADRQLRSAGDDAAHRRDCRAVRGSLLRVAGDADGVWDRHLFQLCGQDPR